MSKLLPALLGIACIFWISTWIYQLTKQEGIHLPQTAAIPYSLSISHHNFSAETSDLLSFSISEEQPQLTDSSSLFLQKLTAYLTENPGEKLILTGVYTPEEKNRTVSQNLGIARAEAVKSILVQKGAPAGNILTRYLQSNSLPKANGKILNGVFFSFEDATAVSEPNLVKTGQSAQPEQEVFEPENGRIFLFSNGEASLKESHRTNLRELRHYLRANPSLKIVITGYSEPEEEFKTNFNLAEMRARAIRRYLVDSGTRRRQIEIVAKPSMAEGEQGRVATIAIQ
jgi:outer membrane protein OmpA-like peptidoglycan-associated protein